ncbi:MAG: N-acetyltransferase [Bacteroidetes bacterium]|nr:N-acetyltransferase [Fibrella sp.]
MDTTTNPVQLNNARHRFEMTTDGKLSFVEFQQADDETLALIHTEVHPDLEGQGVGSKLVKGVLDYARTNNLHIMPYCPFVAIYLKRHADYQDLIKPGFQVEP